MTVLSLIAKDFTIELRRRQVILGLWLFLITLCFISYLTFNLNQAVITPTTWSVLFWLMLLFAVVNSVAKTFIGEQKGLQLYLYTLAAPESIILSKIIYNTILSFLLAVTGYFFFGVFLSDPVVNLPLFLAALGLASVGFAASLSFVSGIAARTSNANIIMIMLGFPPLVSVLLLGIRITKNAIDELEMSASYDELLSLAAIDCIVTGLTYLLFPYIWRS